MLNKQLGLRTGDYKMKNTGVRFSDEELHKIDELKRTTGLRSRNAVLAALVRNAEVREVRTKMPVATLAQNENSAGVRQDIPSTVCQ